MEIYDCHIHIMDGDVERDAFFDGMRGAGISGAALISLPPASFPAVARPRETAERIDCLLHWHGGDDKLFPFFWIDPLEPDAAEQVSAAVKAGVSGFKVICDRYYPGDARAMGVFRLIAETGKPMLFHSGILWDGKPSSMYNRPVCFEPLLEIKKLRFAMAHIAWPWCDEMLAVYGKFQSAFRQRPDLSCELFIDTTPGTPPIYREEALRKVFTIGYNINGNVLFGTDKSTGGNSWDHIKKMIDRDLEIYRGLGLSEETIEAVFGKNLLRLLGKD